VSGVAESVVEAGAIARLESIGWQVRSGAEIATTESVRARFAGGQMAATGATALR
jgi:hypothetical protein